MEIALLIGIVLVVVIYFVMSPRRAIPVELVAVEWNDLIGAVDVVEVRRIDNKKLLFRGSIWACWEACEKRGWSCA